MHPTSEVVLPGRGRPYLPGDSLDHSAALAVWIPELVPAATCAALIARITALGPAAAPVTTHRGMVMMPDVRNNERVMFDDRELAATLWDLVAPLVPATLCESTAVGLNERFRGYRYRPGHRFAPHYDGAFVRDDRERSLLTLLLYLDEGCTGGATSFPHHDRAIVPRRGGALWFQHHLWHAGDEVTAGEKHVLRTDVMYRAA
jgi:prolyl 4-hydroxylase